MEIYSQINSARPPPRENYFFKHFIIIFWWFCFGNIFRALHKSIYTIQLSPVRYCLKNNRSLINYPDVFRWLKTIVGITESSFSYATCTTLTVTDTSTKMTLIVSQSNLPSWRDEGSGAIKGEDSLPLYFLILKQCKIKISEKKIIQLQSVLHDNERFVGTNSRDCRS